VFVLLIGVPHLLGGLAVTLVEGQPMGAVFIGSGTLCCLLAGLAFGADWRAALGVVLAVIVAVTALVFVTDTKGG
jgi:hypothetical protein